jgi:hypothetical protein
MKQLPTIFTTKGFTHDQITRNSVAAVYAKWDGSALRGYEVFKIKKQSHQKRVVDGREIEYPAKERYPSDEDFGHSAFFIEDWAKAEEKFLEITQKELENYKK